MNNFPWLTALALTPLVGALILALLPKGADLLAKRLAVVFSMAVLLGTVYLALQFQADSTSQFQFAEKHDWIPAFGASYSVGVDGIALVLIALSAVLVPIVMIAGWHEADKAMGSVKGYFALLLALESCMIWVFSATDVFLFYVFFEVMLIPMYFLIGRYGGPRRQYAAVKFLLYSLLGGLLMLAAIIGLYVVSAQMTGTGSFDYATLVALNIDPDTQKLLFLGVFFAFAVKAPMVPVHTWLPDAAGEATPGSAVLLVGVLDKVGTFGMLRYCLPIFPDASAYYAPVIIVIAVVGIIYGALLAIGQSDIKRLIAYTSVSHFGFIVLGIFAFTTLGQSGSALYMVNHGFSTAALFLIGGFLISRRGSQLIADFGGVAKVAPLMAGLFLVAGLSSLALPGMSTFVSEFLVLVGTFTRYPAAAAVATVGIILAAVYVLWLYQRTMTGEPGDEVRAKVTEIKGREVVAIIPVLAIIVALGFVPQVVLNVVNPAVGRTMQSIGATDPQPQVVAEPVQGAAK